MIPTTTPEYKAEIADMNDAFGDIEAVLADVFVDNRIPLPEQEEDDMDYGVGDCS
jgi:hypothetical protein